MAERFLIDTSAVIKYLNDSFPAHGIAFMDNAMEEECIISFITEIELQSWNPANESDMDTYLEFIAASIIFAIDSDIIKAAISIRKNKKLKIPDAIIAATALVNHFTLVADNDKDFSKITGLKYINPMNTGA